jgi:hypothetical protein
VATNAPPPAYLQAARTAIAHGRTGEAMEALERAETRVLQRISAPPRYVGASTNPFVIGIEKARDALARGDLHAADAEIADLLAHTHMVLSH